MAPIYPTAHPRYAPHTILVVTWSDDVGAAQDTGVVAKIREAMAKAHGAVYDANELMCPRCPPHRHASWNGNLDGSHQGLRDRVHQGAGAQVIQRGPHHGPTAEEIDPTLEIEVLLYPLESSGTWAVRFPWYRGRCPLPLQGWGAVPLRNLAIWADVGRTLHPLHELSGAMPQYTATRARARTARHQLPCECHHWLGANNARAPPPPTDDLVALLLRWRALEVYDDRSPCRETYEALADATNRAIAAEGRRPNHEVQP